MKQCNVDKILERGSKGLSEFTGQDIVIKYDEGSDNLYLVVNVKGIEALDRKELPFFYYNYDFKQGIDSYSTSYPTESRIIHLEDIDTRQYPVIEWNSEFAFEDREKFRKIYHSILSFYLMLTDIKKEQVIIDLLRRVIQYITCYYHENSAPKNQIKLDLTGIN